jgi:sugar lactone lactonase YvrE
MGCDMLTSASKRCQALAIAVMLSGLMLQAAPARAACVGDCDGDGSVTVDEVLQGVNIVLGVAPMAQCPVFDRNGFGDVAVDDLIASVSAALEGCPRPLITTVAGTGLAGLNDDGQGPLETHLYLPQDVTIGPDGYLYIVDWNNHRIRRIKDGIIETVAGSGELGDAQDGVGIYTQFNHPTNVEFDHDGHMIIAAWHNSLVKRLYMHGEKEGFAENVAGTGARSFGGDDGPANSAHLDLPSSVAIDANGNILISDQANYRIRLVEPDGTIHTICGDGTPAYSGDGSRAEDARLNGPRGQSAPPASRICIDNRDRIYIADTGNNVVRMIDSDGTIRTIAGTGERGYGGDDGPATEAKLNTPSDVAIASNGIVYVADTMNHVIRMISPDGIIRTLAGTGERGFGGDGGPADEALLDRPYGLTVSANGDVYIADTHNQRIRKVVGVDVAPVPTPEPEPLVIIPCTDEVGSICTYAGTGRSSFDGDGHDRLETTLYWPFDIEFTPSGRRILLDWNNHKVREILADETIVTIAGSDFVGDGPHDLSDLTPEGAEPLTVDLNHPTDIQEFPNGDIMFMAWHNHKIREIDAETGRVRVILGAGAGGFPVPGDGVTARDARVNQPSRATLDANGNLFIVDQRNQRIRVLYDFANQRADAIIRTVVGTGERGFNGDGPALARQLNFPTGGNPEPTGGIAIDAEGVIYFADTNNHRIRKVVFSNADFTEGEVTTIAGTGTAGDKGDGGPALDAEMEFPQDVEIGPDGNLYFCDTNNNRVRMINLSTGTIEAVAGTGERAYGGDGGSALTATLNRPFGIAFDRNGDLYISDTFNGRIRKVKR